MQLFNKRGSPTGAATVAVLSAASMLTSCTSVNGPFRNNAHLFDNSLDTSLVQSADPKLQREREAALRVMKDRSDTLKEIKKQVEKANNNYRKGTPFAGELVDEVTDKLCKAADSLELRCQQVKSARMADAIACRCAEEHALARDKALDGALTELLSASGQKERFKVIGRFLDHNPYAGELANCYAPEFKQAHGWQAKLLRAFIGG